MNFHFMMIEPLRLFFGATLEDPNLAPPTVPNDPLVNHSWHNFTYIAALIFAIVLIVMVGVISKKVEHAIAFALIFSLLLIGVFLLVGH